MTKQETDNNHKSILLDCLDGKHWSAAFTGRVTRRDLNFLRRVLTVEYARHERNRRIARNQASRTATEVTPELEPKPEKASDKPKPTEPVTTETPKNVYRP